MLNIATSLVQTKKIKDKFINRLQEWLVKFGCSRVLESMLQPLPQARSGKPLTALPLFPRKVVRQGGVRVSLPHHLITCAFSFRTWRVTNPRRKNRDEGKQRFFFFKFPKSRNYLNGDFSTYSLIIDFYYEYFLCKKKI